MVTEASAAVAAPSDYKLTDSDQIRVTIFGEPNLSGVFVIENGHVNLPLVGAVDAQGQTLTALQAAISSEYVRRALLKAPKISVELLGFRPVYVLGEVNHPGIYPFSPGMTYYNAIASAQGFTYRASLTVVYITHLGDKVEHKERVSPGLPLKPGDVLRVGQRFF